MDNSDRLADSAGVPWQGRHFETNAWQSDDGTAPVDLLSALTDLKAGSGSVTQVIQTLRGTRLLIPLLAQLGEAEMGPHGKLVEKSADLSIVAVSTPDGASAIPAFTDVDSMKSWNPLSRPIPVPVNKLALAAVAEGHSRVVINPATERVALRKPQLKALATGEPWLPVTDDPHALQAIEAIIRANSEVIDYSVRWADPLGGLLTPEIELTLELQPGLSAAILERLLTALAESLTANTQLHSIDSFGFKLVAASAS